MAVSDVYVELKATIADFQAKFSMAADQITLLEAAQTEAAAKMAESAEATGTSMSGEADDVVAAADAMSTALDATTISAARMAAGMEGAAAESALAINKMATELQANMIKMQLVQDETVAKNEAADAKIDAANSAAVTGVASKAALAGAAVGALGVIAVDMAAKYQSATTRLVTSAGEQQAALASVQAGMLQMAGQVGFTAGQLAAGMYTVESAGYHGAAGLIVLRAAAQGAKAEGADLTTVADAVSTALNDYHLPASQAATVTSQLITAVGLGKTTLQDFAGALHSITPLAANMGISLADVTGSLAAMTAHGMSADQASQNLAETLRTLQKPSTQATAALAQIGWTVTDVQTSLSQRGLQGTLEALSQSILEKMGPSGKVLLDAFNTSKQAVDNLDEALKVAPAAVASLAQKMIDGSLSVAQYRTAIKSLPVDQQNLASGFLTMINEANGFTNTLKEGGPQALTYTQMLQNVTGNATTMNTALMLTRENSVSAAAGIQKIAGTTADASGNVKGFAEIQGTLNQRVSEAKAGFDALAIEVGQRLLPAVSTIVGWLADLASWLTRHQSLATVLAVGLAGLTTGLLAAAAATWVFNSALLANPITWVVAGLVLLGGIVYEVIDHWRSIAGFFSGLWGDVKRIFSEAVDWIVHVFEGWYPLILGVLSGGILLIPALLVKYWSNIVSFFSDLWRDVSNAFSVGTRDALHFVENLPHEAGVALGYMIGLFVKSAEDAGRGFYFALLHAFDDTVKFLAALPGAVGDFFKSAATWLVQAGEDVLSGLGDGIVTGAVAVVKFFSVTLPDEIQAFFRTAPSWLVQHGEELLDGLGHGILTAVVDVYNYFTITLPANIRGFFNDAETWLVDAGRNIVLGIWHGIESMVGWLWQQVTNFASGIVTGVKKALGINSPSREGFSIGQFFSQGVGLGVEDQAHVAVTAAQKMAGQVVGAMSGMSASLNVAGSSSAYGASPAGVLSGGVNGQTPIQITINIAGNAVTEKELISAIQTGMAQLGQRNSQTYRAYKR